MARVDPAGRWLRVIVLQLAASAASSCAHDESPLSDVTPPGRSETVNVVLKEWYILPDKKTVDAGSITFKIANQGRTDHEFIVIKTTLPLDALPVHEKGLDEEKAGKTIGEVEDIRPGETREVTYHLPPGSYVLFCNRLEMEDHEIESHYRYGMRVAFTVR